MNQEMVPGTGTVPGTFSWRIHVLSLGCARTLVDSEGLAGLLEQAGHRIAEGVESSDCVVVNTCAFIQAAEEESIATVLDLAELKKKGKIRRLYVAGCLPQKRRGEQGDLLKLLPEVDGFLGPGDLAKLPELMAQQLSRPELIAQQISRHPDPPSAGKDLDSSASGPQNDAGIVDETGRFFVTSPVPTLLFESAAPKHRLTPKHFAYLKISEGCDHACTFCSIPQYRGAHRSRSIEDLVEEARRLASEGVVELNLIGQDTSFYGKDRYGRLRLADLLRALDRVDGVRWIRVLYAHPAHVTDELITALRECRRVVKYIDIPLQHVSDPLLAAMRRETDGAAIRRLVERFRREVPGLAIRTTFIVGFPGETEEQVEELARFLQEARFERVGMFPYSPEPKTPAERMPGQVPEEVRQGRLNRLMVLQRSIAEEIHQSRLGQEAEVLVEEKVAGTVQQGGLKKGTAHGRDTLQRRVSRRGLSPALSPSGLSPIYLGRTAADAPEVDGQVFLHSSGVLRPGQFVRARITDTHEYDLVAEAIAPVPGTGGR